MVLFFAWTDIQLINCLNTKSNFFKNVNADLVVYKRERISERLLEIVRTKEVFSDIYVVALPDFYNESKVQKSNKISSFIIHMQLKRYFINKISCMIKSRKYDVLLVATFWSETLNLYRYLRRYNKDIRIEIVEEGMANYNGPKNWIYRAAPTSNFKAVIRDVFYCGCMGRSARRKVHCFYLYKPEMSWMYQNVKVEKLPPIDKNNTICYEVFEEWQKNVDNSFYNKSKFIFIIDAPNQSKNSYNVLADMIESMSDSKKKVSVVKQHPLYIEQDKSHIMSCKNGIIIDNRKLPIENILFHCEINDKVLIVNQSSALLYLKCMLNKEPYVILTYRMRPYCEKRLIDKFDFFSEKLKRIYSNPCKIRIPNTLDEFQSAIEMIEKNIIII